VRSHEARDDGLEGLILVALQRRQHEHPGDGTAGPVGDQEAKLYFSSRNVAISGGTRGSL
jgi:hypothetical protein